LRILITGGSGFLGQSLLPLLLNHEIILLGRKKPEIISNFKNLTYIEHDLRKNTFPNIPEKIDAIIHLAAIASGEAKNTKDYFTTNVLITRNLLKFAKETKIPHFIFASSVSVYGAWKKSPLIESDALLGTSPYAVSKIIAEKEIVESGINFCILRIASVFGNGSKSFISKLENLANKGFLPMAKMTDSNKSFVHIDDLVRFIQIVLEKKVSGIFNIAHKEEIEFNSLIKLLIKNKQKENPNKKIRIVLVPNFVLQLEKFILYIFNKELGLKPLFEQFTVSSDKAKSELGFEASVSVKEYLSDK